MIIDTYGWTFTDGGKLPFCGEDNDADGVLDQNDVCLNTRPNVTVDEKGCEIISNNAITVYNVAPSCRGVSNAGIRISSSLIDYSFDISIIGTYSEDYLGVSLNDPFEIKDLSPGLYTLNISIPEISYSQTYGVNINEGSPISGKRENLDAQLKSVSYTVQGSYSYKLDINGKEKTFDFDSKGLNRILLNDLSIFNSISISGESDCQGIIKDSFNFADGIVMYPIVTRDKAFIEGLDEESIVEVYDVTGRLLFQKKLTRNEHQALDFETFDSGIYPVRIISKDNTKTFKIIKQ